VGWDQEEERVERVCRRDASFFAADVAAIMARPGSAAPAPGASVLIDIRDLTELPSRGEAGAIADGLATVQVVGGHRMAILARAGAQFGVARMVSSLAELRGASLGAFTEEGEALQWLGSAAGELAEET
jgi:hypothetical protein